MIENILAYLQENYLTLNQLSKSSDLAPQQIRELIRHHCLPTYSHKLFLAAEISQPSHKSEQFEHYETFYAPSLVDWIEHIKPTMDAMRLAELSVKIQHNFENEFIASLTTLDGAHDAFPNCFTDDGHLDKNTIKDEMDKQWELVLNGTYGIDLKHISAKNIILLKIALNNISHYLNKDYLNDLEKQRLIADIHLYNSVATHFGPHEAKRSNRELIVNSAIRKFLVTGSYQEAA